MENNKEVSSVFEELNKFVKKRQLELSDKDNMISFFEGEKAINNDYKGRQLLELIQNADDAGSKYVNIIIDTGKNKLQIVNEGEPFTFAGFRSLMIPNLSTKRKKKYIGNKGLGFRSILNWSDKITISSAGCIVSFSVEQAKIKFLELYPNKSDRAEILDEFGYSEDATPFPIFALPNVHKAEYVQSVTTIEIDYYNSIEENDEQFTEEDDDDNLEEGEVKGNVEQAILKQVKKLKKEVLLFLNHIETIHISVDGAITEYNCNKGVDTINIDDLTWRVFDNKVDGEDPLLPKKYKTREIKDEESYSLKIAIREDLNDDIFKLFSFFPTKIGLHLPMIVHGTFELDSSRNRLIETDKNKFLVGQLINLIFKINDSFYGETANWDKLRLLNYNGNRDTVLEEFGFYDAIDKKIKTLAVLPCIDGTYRSYSNIKFHPNGFSELIEVLGQQNYFPVLIQKIPEGVLPFFKTQFPDYFTEKRYSDSNLKSKAEEVSRKIYKAIPVELYSKWISDLSYQFPLKGQLLSILFNMKGEIIESKNTIFTPPSETALVEVPVHIEIDYLNSDLFEALVRDFGIDEENKARKIKDKLESFINIQSFEPAPVLTRIVTNTRKLIDDTESTTKKQEYTKAMLKSLFDYFNLSNRAKNSQIRTDNIPVLNVLGEIIYAKDSFLSYNYPSGLLRMELLGDLYKKDQLIASGAELGLGKSEDVEEFLVDFLGVNKFLQLESVPDKTQQNHGYLDFVFKIKPKPERYRSERISYTQIKNLDIIKRKIDDKSLTKEQFVTWICADTDVKEKLNSFSDTEFRYDLSGQTSNVYNSRLYDMPSYIRYQLSSLGVFKDFLINDMGTPIINDFTFDYKAESFQKRHIDATAIKETLKQLGAETEFSDLSIEKVETILRSLPNRDPQGRNARKIYQLAIDHFEENQETLKSLSGLMLHCTKEKVKQYIPYEEIFYANKIGLPKKILNEKAILNYAKRSGEQNIAAFFQVQTFENINYTAGDYLLNENPTLKLKAYLKKIRAFILVHRLQKLKEESDIRKAVRTVKSINIILCAELAYNFDGVNNEGEKYDFVASNEDEYTYLIKYSNDSSIDVLKQDSELSDVISEIYSIVFDLANIQEEIRYIYRNDINDTLHQVIEKFGEGSLSFAKSKLEIANGELEFWDVIYKIKEISEKIPSVDDDSEFRKTISEELSIGLKLISHIDFDTLDLENNLKYLKELFFQLNVSLSDFNANYWYPISFYEYHARELEPILASMKEDFNEVLWRKYSIGQVEEQKTFIKKINSFDSLFLTEISEENKFIIDVNYKSKIAQLIKTKFDLVIPSDMEYNSSFIVQYEENKKTIEISEEQINTLSIEDRSLLYFNVGIDELNKIKEKLRLSTSGAEALSTSSSADEEEGESDSVVSKTISELLPSGKKKKVIQHRKKSRKGFTTRGSHSSDEDDAKNVLGKKCEEEALKALRDLYTEENVIWLSGYSNHPDKGDDWGYDMKYRVNRESAWQLVEVKAFYNEYFYFTKRELEVARANRDSYYLYLVGDKGIFVKLFQELLNEDLEFDYDNDFFVIETKDYIFTKK